MRLLLTSQRLGNPSLQNALRELLDKPTAECNVVYIPTAATPHRADKKWLAQDMGVNESLGWKSFDIIDLAAVGTWPKDMWWQAIEDADVIMVGGGNSGYLSYWMQESGLYGELPRLLETKVYVGSSAGSMFVTPNQFVSSDGLNAAPDYQFPLHMPGVPEGQIRRETLGLVDFLFRPHWKSWNAPSITEERIQQAANDLHMPVYLVDDQTAIKVVDGAITVISEGEWTLLTPK